jgi:hypothetical protein
MPLADDAINVRLHPANSHNKSWYSAVRHIHSGGGYMTNFVQRRWSDNGAEYVRYWPEATIT